MAKLSSIKPNPSNPRIIKDEKFEKLKQSITDFPQMMELRPMIVDESNTLLGGNMRFKALQDLGYKEIPDTWIKKASELTEEQKKEFIIKDNVGFGEWEWEQLANEWDVEQLTEWGLDIPDYAIAQPEAVEDDYEIPDTIETDIVLGDLFEIGQHRLLCGDSTDSDAVARLMNGQKADMVFTDPPYNIGFKGSMSNTTKDGIMIKHKGANQKHEEIKNDKMSDDEFNTFMCDILKEIQINNKGAYYITFGSQVLHLLLRPLNELGIDYKSIIIWRKNQATLSGKDYKSCYEPIVYGCPANSFYGERFKQEDIWEFQRTLKNDLHPTMKPIPLIENALKNSSRNEDTVLDLFLGSGSTMVAAHQLNRKCYGMELDPKYCQVIVDRMLKLDPTIEIKRNGEKYVNTVEKQLNG